MMTSYGQGYGNFQFVVPSAECRTLSGKRDLTRDVAKRAVVYGRVVRMTEVDVPSRKLELDVPSRDLTFSVSARKLNVTVSKEC